MKGGVIIEGKEITNRKMVTPHVRPTVRASCYGGEEEGPFPKHRSKMERFPEAGSVLVGKTDGVRREKVVLSARKAERHRLEWFLQLLGRVDSQKS